MNTNDSLEDLCKARPELLKNLGGYVDPGKSEDVINNPKHYEVVDGIEAKDIIKATLVKLYGEDAYKAYCHGNMLKYALRSKGEVEQDIGKIGRYAQMYRGEDE